MKYLILVLLCVACGGDDFTRIEELKGFRILGIQTATPEVVPGPAVFISDLKIYFSDAGSGGRQLTGTTVSCIDPGIGLGANVNCDHDPGKVTGSVTLDTSLPTNGFFTGLSPALAPVTIPPTILLGRSEKEKFNGVGYIIIFNFSVDGKAVSAFKRIVATTRGSLNTNPSGSALLLNGAPIGRAPLKGDKYSVTSSSQETYQFRDAEDETENRREEYQVAWYVSQGKLDKPKSFLNDEVEYMDDPTLGPFLQIAVIRDERGGIEFLQFPL